LAKGLWHIGKRGLKDLKRERYPIEKGVLEGPIKRNLVTYT
jgi:hypothetical protein